MFGTTIWQVDIAEIKEETRDEVASGRISLNTCTNPHVSDSMHACHDPGSTDRSRAYVNQLPCHSSPQLGGEN